MHVDQMEEGGRNHLFNLILKELKELDLDEFPEFLTTIVDKPFNSKMMEIFQGSNIEEILEKMFAYIKTQIENPACPSLASP